MNIILVTGASSGMGKEFVLQVDKHFPKVDEIWLIARRKERLQELANQCKHTCRILDLDLTDSDSYIILEELLKQENPKITLFINNAGMGIIGTFAKMKCQEMTETVRLNCEAVTAVNSICIPYMKKNSRLIMMSSCAAFIPQPGFSVYAASKSFVLSLARALKEELKEKKIYVTAVCPGPVMTEFFDKAEKYDRILGIKKFFMANPESVVKKALIDSKNKKAVSVYGLSSKFMQVAGKILPHGILIKITNLLY